MTENALDVLDAVIAERGAALADLHATQAEIVSLMNELNRRAAAARGRPEAEVLADAARQLLGILSGGAA